MKFILHGHLKKIIIIIIPLISQMQKLIKKINKKNIIININLIIFVIKT